MFKTPSDKARFDKWCEWYDSLPEHTKEYLKNQPLWHDRDLLKVGLFALIVGFGIGVIVGYEWAWKPVVQTFRPLVG